MFSEDGGPVSGIQTDIWLYEELITAFYLNRVKAICLSVFVFLSGDLFGFHFDLLKKCVRLEVKTVPFEFKVCRRCFGQYL